VDAPCDEFPKTDKGVGADRWGGRGSIEVVGRGPVGQEVWLLAIFDTLIEGNDWGRGREVVH